MFTHSEWCNLNDVILLIHGNTDSRTMRQYFLQAMDTLISYDKACFYLFKANKDDSLALSDPVTIGISKNAMYTYANLINTDIAGCRVMKLHRTKAYRSSDLLPKVDVNKIGFLRDNNIAWYCGIVLAIAEHVMGEVVFYRTKGHPDFSNQELAYLDILKEHLLLRMQRTSDQTLVKVPVSLISLGLTQRECDISDLVLKQYNTKEISAKLTISQYTTKKHLNHIFHKLNVKNRLQLANLLQQVK